MPDVTARGIRAKCPFYRSDDGKKHLTCEGVIEDCSLTWNFKSKAKLTEQMDIFCCEYYKNCEVYRMIMEARY